MNTNGFLNQDNITTLWEVISDEEIFKFLPKASQSKTSQVFLNNIKGFFETERTKTTKLVDMNKKYIILMLNHIKQTFVPQMPNKIKISADSPVKELITYEEIQTDRQSQFEKDLTYRQEEFTRAMKPAAPQVPDFADKLEDQPIAEMDKLLKQMTANRNYEVEQINRTYTSDVTQTSNWLKAQETSLKSEKNPVIDTTPPPIPASRFKFLNIEESDGSVAGRKNVTWGTTQEIDVTSSSPSDDELESNIFKKLKRVAPDNQQDTPQNNIHLLVHEVTQETRIANIETQITELNSKMDIIIQLLRSST
jgi:hypothetical protein